MKTKNNVQKAITKSIAVVISLVLVSITVNAQEFWSTVYQHSSFNEIAMAMITDDAGTTTSSTGKLTLTAEKEATLELENWMTSETFFNTNTANLETVNENALDLETWMFNDVHFGNTTPTIVLDSDNTLKLEDWMVNDAHFSAK